MTVKFRAKNLRPKISPLMYDDVTLIGNYELVAV